MSNLISAPRSLFGGVLASREDKAAGKALSTVRTGAFLERAEDEAQLQLTLAKMHDIGEATHHAFEEGDLIVADLVSRTERNPYAAKALEGLAEEGIYGLRRKLRRLSGGF